MQHAAERQSPSRLNNWPRLLRLYWRLCSGVDLCLVLVVGLDLHACFSSVRDPIRSGTALQCWSTSVPATLKEIHFFKFVNRFLIVNVIITINLRIYFFLTPTHY